MEPAPGAMPLLVCARNDWRMRTADGARNKINVSLMFSEPVRRRLMLQQDLLPPLILADDPHGNGMKDIWA